MSNQERRLSRLYAGHPHVGQAGRKGALLFAGTIKFNAQ
jgi:hypothetical protein